RRIADLVFGTIFVGIVFVRHLGTGRHVERGRVILQRDLAGESGNLADDALLDHVSNQSRQESLGLAVGPRHVKAWGRYLQDIEQTDDQHDDFVHNTAHAVQQRVDVVVFVVTNGA